MTLTNWILVGVIALMAAAAVYYVIVPLFHITFRG